MRTANSLAAGIALLMLLGGASGCGKQHQSNERGRQIALTSQRVAQLEESIREGQAEMWRLREAMQMHGIGQDEVGNRLEALDADLARIQDQLEGWQLELRQVRRHVDSSLRADERWRRHVDGRLDHVENMLGVHTPPLGAADAEPEKVATKKGEDKARKDAEENLLPEKVPEDAAGQLALAQTHLRKKETAVARAILEHGLQMHPEAPEGAELRYRLAETWFAESRWSQAASAFQAVAESHPSSDWAAWALVRQGECFRSMGDAETARIYFEDVVRLHPDTKAAQEAKKLSDGML